MLFVLVMECFNAMVKVADSRGLFCPLRRRSIKQRVSLYADDVVIFLSLVVLDLVMIRAILDLFRQASGLATNINKSKAFPIRCDEERLSVITHTLGCQCADFPCTYLGVPLSPWRLLKSAMQPVVDKVAKRLSPWKGMMLNRSGRLIVSFLPGLRFVPSRCTFLWLRRSSPGPFALLRSWFGVSFGADLRLPWEGDVQWPG
jgi:hypothetical protein